MPNDSVDSGANCLELKVWQTQYQVSSNQCITWLFRCQADDRWPDCFDEQQLHGRGELRNSSTGDELVLGSLANEFAEYKD